MSKTCMIFEKSLTLLLIFRATYNMDIKLDFVPASLINFVSRQLVASGHKLFQKVPFLIFVIFFSMLPIVRKE
jgi:hypothetical protein